jgi:hypothetical protein
MKTEFNKTQGLFDASAGNSFSLSHAKPSLRAKGSIAFTNPIADNESLTLTDTSGNSLTFKADTAVDTVDGTLDADGNTILGINGANNAAGQVDRLVAVINAVSGLNILPIDDGNTCTLYQEVNGAAGNTTIQTFAANGDIADNLTSGTKTNFTGGKNEGTAETATGIHFLLEEVSVNQTVLEAGNNIVVSQLSHKLPENSVVLRASLTHSFVDSAVVDADSGNYELFICDTTKAVGAAQAGTSVEIADEIATTSSSVGTSTASGLQAVGNEQFVQLVCSANNAAEDGLLKFLVAIQYAGMGEPIKI